MLTVTRFLLEENGQSLSEYALIVSIMVLSVILTLSSVGSKISILFNNASAQISQ